jgi:hypothetical protein
VYLNGLVLTVNIKYLKICIIDLLLLQQQNLVLSPSTDMGLRDGNVQYCRTVHRGLSKIAKVTESKSTVIMGILVLYSAVVKKQTIPLYNIFLKNFLLHVKGSCCEIAGNRAIEISPSNLNLVVHLTTRLLSTHHNDTPACV